MTDSPASADHLAELLFTGDGLSSGSYTPAGYQLRLAAAKGALLSAIVAGALAHQGIADIGVTVATAVVPAVLEIERVAVRPGDRRLLLELRLKDEVRNRSLTEDQLYATLAPETRSVVNRYDFADFVQRLRDAGLTGKAGDGTIRLRAPEDP